jgi:class 3 adenylate cyclase/HAMP domain-containing protein
MRPTISVKIFSIALGLLILMAVVTGLSALNLKKVNNEVLALAEHYIPLEQRMWAIQSAVRDELIHLGRLMQLLQSKSDDAKTAEEEKRLLEESAAQVNQEVTDGVHLIEGALASSEIEVNREQFAVLLKQLPGIITAHNQLHDTIILLLTEREHGNERSIRVVRDVLRKERRGVDQEINTVMTELQAMTRASAKKAETLELRAIAVNWGITIGASILGLLFAALITRNLVRPVKRLLIGTRAVEQGDLSVRVLVTTTDEIAVLTISFNHMIAELKQKEVIKETFGKYMDPRIVKGILEDQRFSHGGERRLMTVFFSDMEGFTSLGERLTPDGIVKVLNQYFTLMSEQIREFHGIIDKYIGDAIMAFWGPPFTDGAEHASLACLSALEQYKKLSTFRQMLPDIMGLRKDLPTINLRMGIATGDVTVGSIGSENSKSYTVIGDTVNLASRLEAVNKEYGTQLLISEETWKMAQDAIEARELDCIQVAGKSEPVRIFELLERKGQLNDKARSLRDHFAEGLALYRSQSWDLAQARFSECLKINPADRPSKLFIARLQHFRGHPLSPDWDGVWRFQEK